VWEQSLSYSINRRCISRCPIIKSPPPQKSISLADNLPVKIRPARRPKGGADFFPVNCRPGADFSGEERSYNWETFYEVGDHILIRGDISNPCLSLPWRIFHGGYFNVTPASAWLLHDENTRQTHDHMAYYTCTTCRSTVTESSETFEGERERHSVFWWQRSSLDIKMLLHLSRALTALTWDDCKRENKSAGLEKMRPVGVQFYRMMFS